MKTIEYYLMRHAAYYDFENQYVSYYGMLSLQASMSGLQDELSLKYPDKKLRIIHSVLPRVKHTALLAKDMLMGIEVFLKGDPTLNSDKLLIDEAYVKKVVASCEEEDEICLILSHEPDIKHFSHEKLNNSEYISMTVALDEKPVGNKEEDELPF